MPQIHCWSDCHIARTRKIPIPEILQSVPDHSTYGSGERPLLTYCMRKKGMRPVLNYLFASQKGRETLANSVQELSGSSPMNEGRDYQEGSRESGALDSCFLSFLLLLLIVVFSIVLAIQGSVSFTCLKSCHLPLETSTAYLSAVVLHYSAATLCICASAL